MDNRLQPPASARSVIALKIEQDTLHEQRLVQPFNSYVNQFTDAGNP
jgi:hypothetical protein